MPQKTQKQIFDGWFGNLKKAQLLSFIIAVVQIFKYSQRLKKKFATNIKTAVTTT